MVNKRKRDVPGWKDNQQVAIWLEVTRIDRVFFIAKKFHNLFVLCSVVFCTTNVIIKSRSTTRRAANTNFRKDDVKMKKVILYGNVGRWGDQVAQHYLIDANETEQAVVTDPTTLLLTDCSATVKQLQDAYAEYDEAIGRIDEMEDFLESVGVHANVDHADYFEKSDDRIAFCTVDSTFSLLSDWETCLVYTWWDGHNFRTEEVEDATTLEIGNDYVDLDEWDGHNMTTGGIGLHQRVYKVFTVDGERVKDMYLLECWSQWQGSRVTGELLTADELRNHIEELGDRDVEEYMANIEELGK